MIVPLPQGKTTQFVLVAMDPSLPRESPIRAERLEPKREDSYRMFEIWADQMLSARVAGHRFALVGATDPDIIEEFSRSQGFYIAVAPAPIELQYPSLRPTPPFQIKDATGTQNFSMGIYAWNTPHGVGVTTAAHGVTSGTNYSIHDQHGPFDHVHGIVTNSVLDAAFLQMQSLHGISSPAGQAGFLSGIAPNTQISHEFYGATSGLSPATVSGWVDDLLTIQPWLQNRVFTDPVLQGGDSGSALIDANHYIVGFAFYNDPFATTARSAWIWADSVRAAFGL